MEIDARKGIGGAVQIGDLEKREEAVMTEGAARIGEQVGGILKIKGCKEY
jgi:hypothetical protein